MRSKIAKKLLATSVLTAMTIGLVGCGEAADVENQPTQAPAKDDPKPTEAPAKPDDSKTDDPVVVDPVEDDEVSPYTVRTDANGNPYDLGGMEIIIRDWWTNPDNVQEPSNAYEEELAAFREWMQEEYNFTLVQKAISDWGSTPGDFIAYATIDADENNYLWVQRACGEMISAMRQGLMVDLLPYARRTGFDFDDFNSAFWSHCTYGEAVTGLPMSPSGIVLVYNETMYQDKLGHTKSPKTLDELFEFSKKLTVKDGNKTKVYGFTFDRSDGTFIETLGRAFGAVWFGENGVGCPGAYDGTVKKAYQYLRDFVDSGTFYQPATANTNMSNIAAFNSGVVAQICTFVSQIKNIWMLGKNKKFGIDLMPGVTEGQTGYQQIGGQANSISSLTTEKEREAGWLFIEYCVSPEQEIKWGITASTPVRRSSSNQLPELIKYWEENPQLFVGYRLVQAAQDEPYPLSLNQFSSDRTSVVDMVIYEGMSAEKAVLLVQESAEEYLVDTRPTSVIPKTNP